MSDDLTPDTKAIIEKCVAVYKDNFDHFQHLATAVHLAFADHPELRKHIHFTRFRPKDPIHLRGKLELLAFECKKNNTSFDIDENNLFTSINDLAGVRLIHLHTSQMLDIHPLILKIIDDNRYILKAPTTAFTWDTEYEGFFRTLGIDTVSRESMYTSVHYIIEPNRREPRRCEIQVRSLMEEVWAEVSHSIDYPINTASIACTEQLKVLARITSGATRLVDSIFKSRQEFDSSQSRIRDLENTRVTAKSRRKL